MGVSGSAGSCSPLHRLSVGSKSGKLTRQSSKAFGTSRGAVGRLYVGPAGKGNQRLHKASEQIEA